MPITTIFQAIVSNSVKLLFHQGGTEIEGKRERKRDRERERERERKDGGGRWRSRVRDSRCELNACLTLFVRATAGAIGVNRKK